MSRPCRAWSERLAGSLAPPLARLDALRLEKRRKGIVPAGIASERVLSIGQDDLDPTASREGISGLNLLALLVLLVRDLCHVGEIVGEADGLGNAGGHCDRLSAPAALRLTRGT